MKCSFVSVETTFAAVVFVGRLTGKEDVPKLDERTPEHKERASRQPFEACEGPTQFERYPAGSTAGNDDGTECGLYFSPIAENPRLAIFCGSLATPLRDMLLEG